MEEIERKYANQLWESSIFEGYNQDCPSCDVIFKLHDMIHDVARLYSRDGYSSITSGNIPDFPKQLFHLYIGRNVKLVESHPSNKYAALCTPTVDT